MQGNLWTSITKKRPMHRARKAIMWTSFSLYLPLAYHQLAGSWSFHFVLMFAGWVILWKDYITFWKPIPHALPASINREKSEWIPNNNHLQLRRQRVSTPNDLNLSHTLDRWTVKVALSITFDRASVCGEFPSFLIPSHLIIKPLGDNQKVFLDYSRSPGSREIASRCCSQHIQLIELLLSGWSEPCCTLNVCGVRRAFDPRREHFEVGQGMASLSFAYNLWVYWRHRRT